MTWRIRFLPAIALMAIPALLSAATVIVTVGPGLTFAEQRDGCSAHAAGPVTVTVNCAAGSASLPNGFTFNRISPPARRRSSSRVLLTAVLVLVAVRIVK